MRRKKAGLSLLSSSMQFEAALLRHLLYALGLLLLRTFIPWLSFPFLTLRLPLLVILSMWMEEHPHLHASYASTTDAGSQHPTHTHLPPAEGSIFSLQNIIPSHSDFLYFLAKPVLQPVSPINKEFMSLERDYYRHWWAKWTHFSMVWMVCLYFCLGRMQTVTGIAARLCSAPFCALIFSVWLIVSVSVYSVHFR